ncbi:MAG: EamA family transporter RarD [Novosphingobium sp.]|nr:EamA family transporter RarD [Novosphingobium sp.]
MSVPVQGPASSPDNGLPYAIAAYLMWGLLPLYLKLVHTVPALEFVGWRILFTLPVCLLIVAARRQGADLRAALSSPKVLALLLLSALLIGTNWLTYILAVQSGHVLATSLGYYINPLVNVLAGTVFLGERLGRLQWLAVALAAAGVAVLAWGAAETLGISLTLAVSFAGYGLVRKLAPVGSLPGLTIESALLALPAAGLVAWQAMEHGGTSMGQSIGLDALIALSGVVTAVPLLLFATAARRMDYSTLGFCQYIAPTIVFLLALFVFREPLKPVQLVSFALIWAAVALFSRDLWVRSRASKG